MNAKKVIAFFVSVFMVTGVVIFTPQADADTNTVTRTISEYDMLKSLQRLSKEQLVKCGYSYDEINSIKEPLKAKREYGNVTYTISYSGFKWKQKKRKKSKKKYWVTYITTTATWSWSKAPKCLFTDAFVSALNKGFTKYSTYGHINYYHHGIKKNEGKYVVKYTPATQNIGKVTLKKIKMKMGRDGPRKTKIKWIALGGVLKTTWIAEGKKDIVGIASHYGHSTLTLNPGISVNSGGPSISFTPHDEVKYGNEAFENAYK